MMNKKVRFAIIGVCACIILIVAVFLWVNGGIRLNKSKSVTVKLGDIEMDLTADIKKNIAVANDSNFMFKDYIGNECYYLDEEGEIYSSLDYNKLKEKKTKILQVGCGIGLGEKSIEGVHNIPGCYDYVFFDKEHEQFCCDGLSLFQGWDGDISHLNDYMNSTNSYDDGKIVMALFKNGEIVSMDDILEEYSNSTCNIDELPYRDFWGYGASVDISEGQYPLIAALLDWGDKYSDGKIYNYGCVRWIPDNEELNICIACSFEDAVAFGNIPNIDD